MSQALPILPASVPMPAVERERIARSFGRAAAHYDQYAALQRDVAEELLTHVPAAPAPSVVLDMGCGTGFGTALLRRRFPEATLIGLDIALPMLAQSAGREGKAALVCADAQQLPLAAQSVDLIYSSLTIQWCAALGDLFSEVHRVLGQGGMACFSTFGPDSLKELRAAWAAADGWTHVNTFLPASALLREAARYGLQARLVRQPRTRPYADLRAISRELKGIGAHNMNAGQAPGLTGRTAFRQAEQAFAAGQRSPAGIAVTYDIFHLILTKA